MFGDNLPPGVSVTDIPGNRPEDESMETLMSAIDRAIEEARDNGLTRAEVVEALRILLEDYDTPGISG